MRNREEDGSGNRERGRAAVMWRRAARVKSGGLGGGDARRGERRVARNQQGDWAGNGGAVLRRRAARGA